MSTFKAREEIRRAVSALTRAAGDAGMMRRPVVASEPDGPATLHPHPLPAITALMDLRGAISGMLHEQARFARADGEPWDRIAVSMLGAGALPVQAFDAVASSLGDAASFAWTCGTCLGLITDRGPEMGSPLDAERGHGLDCSRFADLVRRYEAGQD